MICRSFAACFLLLQICWIVVSAPAIAEDEKLGQLMDEVWEAELTADPMLATDVGDPRGQDRLPDDSFEAIADRAEQRKGLLDRLLKIERESLSDEEQVDYGVLRARLKRQQADFQFQTHLIPITNREGFHIWFPELPNMMRPRRAEDFKNYISRLRDFDRYASQQIALMRRGLEEGRTLPAVVLREADDQIRPHVVEDPRDSLLYKPFQETRPSQISAEDWDALQSAAREAIEEGVVPGYRRFLEFMEQEYLPGCRGTIAASALPDGRAFYRDRVRQFTTLELEPEEIHQTGLDEVARIREEMEGIREAVDFAGPFDEFVEHLRTDPRFYAETPEQLLKEVALILKRADGRLPEWFGRLPRTPYGIREVPSFVAPQTTSAYYWPPASDGTRAGFYYVNTYNLSARPLYQLEALSLHEAVPGHHLQLALQAEMDDLHPIRRHSNFTAFIEGWALYCERLGKEMGFYEDPYQEFGRLSMEAWRACRLVVDTGIHHLGWTRQEAIAYLGDNTALSRHNVIAEIDRYIAWPGQALGYKVGELKIRDLRKGAEEQLGDRFDIRAFHDILLAAGSIPLPLLEQRVQDWITQHSTIPNTSHELQQHDASRQR